MQLNGRSGNEICEKAGRGLAEQPCLPHDASYHAYSPAPSGIRRRRRKDFAPGLRPLAHLHPGDGLAEGPSPAWPASRKSNLIRDDIMETIDRQSVSTM
jgi:hypothetical protein